MNAEACHSLSNTVVNWEEPYSSGLPITLYRIWYKKLVRDFGWFGRKFFDIGKGFDEIRSRGGIEKRRVKHLCIGNYDILNFFLFLIFI